MAWAAVLGQFRNTWITTLLSLLLFAGLSYFAVWTETQGIESSMMLEELISAAEHVDVNIETDPKKYEGRVIHIYGPIYVVEPISEPDYNLVVHCVKLKKRVQMYQWIQDETESESFVEHTSDQSEKTYWYGKDWRDYVVDSSTFHIRAGHENPTTKPIFSEEHVAETVLIGWVNLGVELKHKVNDYYQIWSDNRPDRADIKMHSGFYFHGESAIEHQIGDLRVTFFYAGRDENVYTAVGQVKDGTLQPYSPAKYPSLEPIGIMQKGAYSLEEIHDLERKNSNAQSWKYRLLVFVQAFAAFMTLHPDWIQIFLQCSWVSNRLRRSSRLWVTLVLAASYTMFIISLPWFIYKPSYGMIFLVGASLPLIHYSTLIAERREATPIVNPYTRWRNPH